MRLYVSMRLLISVDFFRIIGSYKAPIINRLNSVELSEYSAIEIKIGLPARAPFRIVQ
jgi:hypothetical protein